jgi:sn-glycerol 3-phosphate transport system substrate-binding protein
MTRSRHLLTLSAVLLALALVAAGCGGDDGGGGGGGGGGGEAADVDPADCPVDALESATAPVEISFWYAYGGQIETGVNQIVDDYNASQDRVVVTAESQGTAYEELQRKFNQGIQSEDLPNVAIVEDTQNQSMADSGVVVPAAACIEASGEDPNLLEGPVGYYTIEGVQWPGAFNMSSPILYYNRNHFEEAGLDPDDPPGTLDEIREASEAIRDAGVVDSPFVFLLQPWFVETWLTGVGSEIVNNDNGRTGLATDATLGENEDFIEILTWLQDMNDDGLMLPFPQVESNIDHYLALAQQNGSMGIETSAAATTIEAFLAGNLDAANLTEDQRVLLSDDLDLDLDIGAGLLPGLEAPGKVQVAGGAYFMTNTGTPEQIAASWDFLQYVNSVDAQVTNNLVTSYLPTTEEASQAPEITDVWETTLSGGMLATSYEQLSGVDPDFPGPVMGPYTEERAIMREGLEALILEGASPEDVAADMQAQLTEALAAYEEQNF